MVNEDSAVRTAEASDRQEQLEGFIAALEHGHGPGDCDVPVLRKLALFCRANPANEPLSPISPDFSAAGPLGPPSSFGGGARTLAGFRTDLWARGKAFERLFAALVLYLDPGRVRLRCWACPPLLPSIALTPSDGPCCV